MSIGFIKNFLKKRFKLRSGRSPFWANFHTLSQLNITKILKNHAILEKADGKRTGLFIDKYGYLFEINISMYITVTNINVGVEYAYSLFDSEKIGVDSYYIFDVLMYKNDITTNLEFKDRYELFKDINIKTGKKIIKSKKAYLYGIDYTTEKEFTAINKKIYVNTKYPYKLDGIIYVPMYDKYYSYAFKWKPPLEQTIDFFIKEIPTNNNTNDKEYYLFTNLFLRMKGMNAKQVQNLQKIAYEKVKLYKTFFPYLDFNNSKNFSMPMPFIIGDQNLSVVKINTVVDGANRVYADNKDIIIKDETVIEFYFDSKEKDKIRSWKPYRNRYDKTEIYDKQKKWGKFLGPNKYRTAVEIYTALSNPITLDMLTGNKKLEIKEDTQNYYKNLSLKNSKSSQIRSFHRKLKYYLYNTYINKGDNVLELAGGRGGDLNKLESQNVNFVLIVDIDNNGIIEAKHRSNKKKFKIDFLTENCSKNITKDIGKIIKANNIENFNTVNIQFALHYFFKTKTTFNNIFKNIDTYLIPGGYFVATFLDGNAVFNMLMNKKEVSFINNGKLIFKIIKKYRIAKIKDFGTKISVFGETIGEHIEYLVNFSVLKDFFIKHNYELVETKMFGDFDYNGVINGSERDYSFLNRYVVFRKKKKLDV